jgi:DNA-binding PadR family transcriptional regulator
MPLFLRKLFDRKRLAFERQTFVIRTLHDSGPRFGYELRAGLDLAGIGISGAFFYHWMAKLEDHGLVKRLVAPYCGMHVFALSNSDVSDLLANGFTLFELSQ